MDVRRGLPLSIQGEIKWCCVEFLLFFVALLFGVFAGSSCVAQITPPLHECPSRPSFWASTCWIVHQVDWVCTRVDSAIEETNPGKKVQVEGVCRLFENCDGCPEIPPRFQSYSDTLQVSYTESIPTVTLANGGSLQNANTIETAMKASIGHPVRSIEREIVCGADLGGCKVQEVVAVMTSKTKILFGCLISVLGLALLLVAFMPYQLDGKVTSVQDIAVSPKQRSSIRFSEQTVRLDSVNSGDTASGHVVVENIGSKTITNVAVKAGCTCSGIELSNTIILPGETIRIDFSIDTRGKYEDFTDNYLVTYSEDEKNLFDVFYATVPILAPGKLMANPASLQFNRAKVGESFSRVVELRAKDLPENETVEIVQFSTPDWISVNLEKKEAYWKLTLTGDFPNQSGRYVEFVRIKSNSDRYSEMLIPVIVEYATVSPEVFVQ